jgi:hypothetical protein
MRNARLVLAILLAVAGPATADQTALNPQATTRLGALRQAQPSNPYSKLFETREALKQALQQELAKTGAPKTRIVCGMTVVEANPGLDPKMAVSPKANVRHTIRAVEPPTCWSRD